MVCVGLLPLPHALLLDAGSQPLLPSVSREWQCEGEATRSRAGPGDCHLAALDLSLLITKLDINT